MEPLWKEYLGYEVSNLGEVRNKKGYILKPFKHYHKGKFKRPNSYYWMVMLHEKKYKVHHLVASCFLPPKPEGFFVIDHIDGNKDNNKADNLQWLDFIENSKKGATPA